jgi:hypothetical protein
METESVERRDIEVADGSVGRDVLVDEAVSVVVQVVVRWTRETEGAVGDVLAKFEQAGVLPHPVVAGGPVH